MIDTLETLAVTRERGGAALLFMASIAHALLMERAEFLGTDPAAFLRLQGLIYASDR